MLKKFEENAERKLLRMVFDYYAGGSNDEITLMNNIKDYDRIKLIPRPFASSDTVNLETTILGQKVSFPILIAPSAMQSMAYPELGEKAAARAANKRGTIYTLSSISSLPLEDVADAVCDTDLLWFQLYVFKRRDITQRIIKRAEQSGYKAIVLTVDSPASGKREKDNRNNFRYPVGLEPRNFSDFFREMTKDQSFSSISEFLSGMYDPSLNWKDIEWLKNNTKLPVVLKGILSPDDALLAVKHGVSGIIVSNHGGRQLDTSPSTIECLPGILGVTMGTGVEVYIDGGIRSGESAFKALALGCKAVMIGRPVLWGLAEAGEEGVGQVLKQKRGFVNGKVLDLLAEELKDCMNLCGCSKVKDINRSVLYINKRSNL